MNFVSELSIPQLAVFQIGEEPGVKPYMNSLIGYGEENPSIIIVNPYIYEAQVDVQRIIDDIHKCNEDPNISGMIGLKPASSPCRQVAYDFIIPEKDVDCQAKENLNAFRSGKDVPHVPATPEAALNIILSKSGLKPYELDVVIVGKGEAVGLPLAELLKRNNIKHRLIESHPDKNPSWEKDLKGSGANVVVGAAPYSPHVINESNIPTSIQLGVDIAYCWHEELKRTVGNILLPDGVVVPNHEVGKLTTSTLAQHVQKSHNDMRQTA